MTDNVVKIGSKLDAVTARLNAIKERYAELTAIQKTTTEEMHALWNEREELERAAHTIKKYLHR